MLNFKQMKKQIAAVVLIGGIAFSLYGCGSDEKKQTNENEPEIKTEAETKEVETEAETEAESKAIDTETEIKFETETERNDKTEEATEKASETEAEQETLSFRELSDLEFSFMSGVGAWQTHLQIREDGTFFGGYYDSNLGESGEGYENGTLYESDFEGKFTNPVKKNDYTYSVKIEELRCEKEPNTEEIKNKTLYRYVEPYGLEEAEEILIYKCGAPLAMLPQEYREWVGYADLSETSETELPFYGLYNEKEECGFSSFLIKRMTDNILPLAENKAAELENSIENDSLTQTEYNEKTMELYEVWDDALNDIWSDLKEVLPSEEMETLTEEERNWIAEKEAEVKKAGEAAGGGSVQSAVMNLKAAEMTKNRVYELSEMLK